MLKQHLVAMAFLLLSTKIHAIDLDDIVDIVKLGKEVINGIFKAWMVIEEKSEKGLITPSYFNKEEKHLLAQISKMSSRIERMESLHFPHIMATVSNIMHEFPRRIRLELLLHELRGCLSRLDASQAQLSRYLHQGYDNDTDTWHIEKHTLEDFATNAVSHSRGSIRAQMQRLHDLTASKVNGSPLEENLFGKLADSLQEADSISCSLMQSPHQILYNLYNSITLSELKGYTMMQFSWMLLRLYNKGNFTREAQLMHETFEERTKQKLDAVLKAMESAKRDLWRCDPQHQVEGETYVQLTKLLQGHVQNEVDMNQDNTCRDNCNYYSFAQSTGCFDNRVCSKMEQCKGRLLECRYIDSDMWVCPADRISGRRYDWIEYENGRFLGKRGSCRNRTYKVDSWWRWVFWHCSYCFCICDEQGPHSDRYFNLRPVVADTANNKVITGLRFAKVNRVVHMQIQEGRLLPRGGINESTLQWKSVDNYSISDSNVNNGLDYHTLSWEQRAIDLDDLEAPPGHVVTGFRFRNIGTHLNPEIMVSPMNFTAGKLIKPEEKSLWISNDNTDASYITPRSQLKLTLPDLPTNSHLSSVPDSRSDQYLIFTHSDIDSDAAQSTVPFIDIQPVNPNPPMLLAGVGIYHKGTPLCGGFIAPKVITYNISSHMRPDFSKAKHL